MPRRAPERSTGFTLVETIVTLTVVTIAVLGVTFAVGFGARAQAGAGSGARALELAQAYLEEIASRRFDEHTPVGGVPPCGAGGTPCSDPAAFDDGEARALFDDVDDYDGLADAPPRDPLGAVRAGYDRFSVAVTVRYAEPGEVAALGLDGTTDAKIVRVRVTPPDGTPLDFTTVRANF